MFKRLAISAVSGLVASFAVTANALPSGNGHGLVVKHHLLQDALSQMPIVKVATKWGKPVNSRSLTWRRGDTAPRLISRLRSAASGYGDACATEQRYFEQLATRTSLSVEGGELAIGQTVRVKWSINASLSDIPAYVVISASKPIRFKGDGIYGLTANAIGPFGIEAYSNQDRAIAALYGRGAKKRGNIRVVPTSAGALNVQISVVGYLRQCKKMVFVKNLEKLVTIKGSKKPEIVIAKQFELDRKATYQVSPNGERIVASSGSGVRILTKDLQTVILSTTGKDARISPTGRFLAVYRRDGMEFFDMIDGASVLLNPYFFRNWDNNESFLYSFGGRLGVGIVENMLVEKWSRQIQGPECNACGNLDDTRVHLDLENDVVLHGGKNISSGRLEISALRLSAWDADSMSKASIQTNRLVDIAPVVVPQGWELRTPAVFLDRNTFEGRTNNQGFTSQHLLTARQFNVAQLAAAGINGKQASSPVSWRARSIGQASENLPRTFWQVAETVGLRTKAPILPTYSGTSKDIPYSQGQSTTFGQKVSREMAKDLPTYLATIRRANQNLDRYTNLPVFWNNCDFGSGRFKSNFPPMDKASRFNVGEKVVWVFHYLCGQGSAAVDDAIGSVFQTDKPNSFFHPNLKPKNVGNHTIIGHFEEKGHIVIMVDPEHLLYWSPYVRGAVLVRLRDGKSVFRNYKLPGGNSMVDVRMSVDGRHLIQLNSDGTFYTHNIARDKIVLSGRYVDDELVVWTDDLRFDATAEGAHFVNLKFPGQSGQYTFQQFGRDLKVPGLAAKVLAGSYQQQRVDVDVPPSITGSFKADKDGLISGTITAEAFGGLASVRILQDGIVTGEFKSIKNGQPTPISFKRAAGTRWVNLVAVDKNGLISHPLGKDMGGFVGNLPRVRLLAMGVDDYYDDGFADLDFAKSDADRLAASLLKQNGKTISLASSTILKNRNVTPKRLIASLERLVDNMSASDTAVLFFAGHGVRGEDGKFYVVLSDTNSKNIKGTGFAWERIAPILQRAKGRVIVLLDACQSGIADKSYFATNDDVANGLLDAIPSGLTILSASKGRELSSEWAKTGGGLYTTALVDVLTNKRGAYDTNRNGSIEVSELYQGVKSHVKQARNVLVAFLQKNYPNEALPGPQTPWLARNQMIGDYTLF